MVNHYIECLFVRLHEYGTCHGTVAADAGFLCGEAVMLEETIKGTPCITCHSV
jgi:hypothetical protein